MITKIKHSANGSFQIIHDSGKVTHLHKHNREYKRVEKWLEEGNEIEPEVTEDEAQEETERATLEHSRIQEIRDTWKLVGDPAVKKLLRVLLKEYIK